MSAKITEKYFGVRVGDPRKHYCYLWCGPDSMVPCLFTKREDADRLAAAFQDGTKAKTVRIKVTSF